MLVFLAVAHAATIDVTPQDDVVSLAIDLQPGDELVLGAGTYETDQVLTIVGPGTSSAPVVIRAADGAQVTWVSDSNARMVEIRSSSFLELRGIDFRSSDAAVARGASNTGLRIDLSEDIVIEDCSVSLAGADAIEIVGVDRLRVAGVEVSEIAGGDAISVGCGDASCAPTDIELTGLYVHDIAKEYAVNLLPGANGVTVSDSVVHDVLRGIRVHSTEGGAENAVLRNALWNVGDAALLVQGAALVADNVVFDAATYGIHSRDPGRGTFADVRIVHNTVAATGSVAAYLELWNGKSGMVFANNALCNPAGRALGSKVGEVDDGNTFAGNVACGNVDSHVPGGWTAGDESDYADFAGRDLYPAADGGLIGAADATHAVDVDFDGTARDSAPDAGAWEWTDAGPGWTPSEGFKDPVEGDADTDADSDSDSDTDVDTDADSDTDEAGANGCGCSGGDGASGWLLLPMLLLARRQRAKQQGSP